MFFSIVIPTFKRKEDVKEFLESMTKQTESNFEVLIVDASPDNSVKDVVNFYSDKVSVTHFHKKGLGISPSRNFGCKNAKGDFFIFIDSDCIVPPDYIKKVNQFLKKNKVDGFGGPDDAEKSFSNVQKAINYAMTSMLTTGGIRGKKVHAGKYQLRGFNMGVSRNAFFSVNGYSNLKVAEDIDLSMRLHAKGYKTSLIPDAKVFHKRKINFKKFATQLFLHGKARIDLQMRHGTALKPIFFLPSLFVIYIALGWISFFINPFLFYLYLASLSLIAIIFFTDASIQNKSIKIGVLSVFASFIQLCSYGAGILYNIFRRLIFRKKDESIRPASLKV